MAPSYSDDNALFLSLNGSPSGTLTVVNPKAGMVLSVIGSVAGGATTIEYVVYHQDGSSTAGEVECGLVQRQRQPRGDHGRPDQRREWAMRPIILIIAPVTRGHPLLNNTSPVTKVDLPDRDNNMALFGLIFQRLRHVHLGRHRV